MKFTNITYPHSSFHLYYYVYVFRAVESCQNITEGQTSCDICKTTLYKVFFKEKLPNFSSFTADRRRRRHLIASSGRRVAPPWPRRTVGWPAFRGWQEQIQCRCGVGLFSAREDDQDDVSSPCQVNDRTLGQLGGSSPPIQQSLAKICTNLLCSETTVYWPHFFAVTIIKAHVHSVTHAQL